jgi:hypothetical protein
MVTTKSMINKIIEERGIRLELLSLKDENGADVYAYILVSEAKYKDLETAVKSGNPFNPEDFGVIYAAGFGTEPNKEIKAAIEQLFAEKLTNNQNY